ncbi:AMP-binding protein [Pandoraea fibrosis]|uniref:AMP-binding protein n=1 Tax=Pandoraea fibrosis TaxID=1891094 RepID=A0ABX6HWM4_9BURK|nr:AMP-binding protein [Pandoraea fibrosis]QHE91552.1 AMP-binding protein [Pandoraea fibrosis]QHF14890.1 AMP-binding protein [Pandoraea fibrosis]
MRVEHRNADSFRAEGATLWQLVARRAALTPDAPILIDDNDQVWTFRTFARAAENVAAWLLTRGIVRQSVIAWQFPTDVRAVVLSVALARLGVVQSPLIPLYGPKEVAAILQRSAASHFILPRPDSQDAEQVARSAQVCRTLAPGPAIIELDRDAFAYDAPLTLPAPPTDARAARWIYYTSGTTSEPKGALHSDASLIAAGTAFAEALDVVPQDIAAIGFPYAHVGGSMNLVMLLTAGMSAVLIRRFAADTAVARLRRHGVTINCGSTVHYQTLLGEQRKAPGTPVAPSLRLLCGGGAPKPATLFHDIKREMGCLTTHSYGMTEAPLITAASPHHGDERLANTDGAPVDGMDIRIIGFDGRVADVDEEGEIRIKGPTVCLGYTDRALNRSAFDDEGYFRTGDVGKRRSDGHIVLTSRIKDVIIRKGENISAREIEDVLLSHPRVGAAAVIGLPDPERGERVCAVVELRNPALPLTLDAVIAWFSDAGVMRQKIPEQLEIVAQLPRNETFNKILKHKLREQFAHPCSEDESTCHRGTTA